MSTEFKKGDRVSYQRPPDVDELGTVTGFSSDKDLVFVLYDGDATSKATRKSDLEPRDIAASVPTQIIKSWTGGSNYGA